MRCLPPVHVLHSLHRSGVIVAMGYPSALARLTRRLNLIGAGLLAAGGVAFVWAVGFTSGVEGLIEGLVVAGVGLFIPGLATLWVSWIIGSASGDERVAPPAPVVSRRAQFAQRLRNYSIAAILVVAAAAARTWLTPYLGQLAPFPTFLMAIAVAAWIGGMGAATFATMLSLPILWTLFLGAPTVIEEATGELVALGLFAATALAVAGVTAALRVTQGRVDAFRLEATARQADLDESEARFRELADRSGKLVWMSDARGHRTFFNQEWCAFTGRTLDETLGDGWTAAIHPEDRERFLAQFAKAHHEREPFTLEYRLRRHDSAYRRMLDRGEPRLMADGRFAGFVGECQDVTDMPLALRRLAHSATTQVSAARDRAGTVE